MCSRSTLTSALFLTSRRPATTTLKSASQGHGKGEGARHPQRTVPAETLLTEVWGREYAGEVEHVKHTIWTLRSKLEADPGDPKHILTERGFGYRFE